jgi:hypothetical protein
VADAKELRRYVMMLFRECRVSAVEVLVGRTQLKRRRNDVHKTAMKLTGHLSGLSVDGRSYVVASLGLRWAIAGHLLRIAERSLSIHTCLYLCSVPGNNKRTLLFRKSENVSHWSFALLVV